MALGAAMLEPATVEPTLDNPAIPAGFTYLGQFVDHDITFDPTPLSNQTVDPFRRRNFRSPRLELDSLYGAGPDDQPNLYTRGTGGQFRFGSNTASPDASGITIPPQPNDLPRDEQRHALIGDRQRWRRASAQQLDHRLAPVLRS